MTRSPPVLGFVGPSGSGKTTLITQLIPLLVASGLRVATVKHAHHGFDLDRPGKDSHDHRKAGASEVLIASPQRWALLHELRDADEPDLATLLGRLSPADLVLVEGFRAGRHRKLEVYRPSPGRSLQQPTDPDIVAVASDLVLHLPVPVLPLHDITAIARFVLDTAVPLS